MFLNACGYSEDVRVKDDVVWVELDFIHQQIVGSGADLYFTCCVCGLYVVKIDTKLIMFYSFILNIIQYLCTRNCKQIYFYTAIDQYR